MSAPAHVPLSEFEALALLGEVREGGCGIGRKLADRALVTLLDEKKRADAAERNLAAIRERLFAKTGAPRRGDQPWERSVWRLTALKKTRTKRGGAR